MALPSFPPLVLRTEKLSALTHAELDQDLKSIRSFCQMLAGVFGVALDAEGNLTPDSVTTISIINRAVTAAKLGPISVFPTVQDTGATNAIAIAQVPPLTAYADGQVFFVKVLNTNTGAATLNVDGIGAVAIKKRGVVDLEAGDYDGGSVIVLGYFSGSFHIIAGTSAAAAAASSSSGGFSGFQVYEPTDVIVPPAAAVAATGTLTSDNTTPSDGDTVTIGTVTYTFKNALTPTAGQVLINGSADAALLNLIRAINHTGTAGTDYANLGTTAIAHPTVSAGVAVTAHSITVTALTAGIAGNSIATTDTMTTAAWAFTTLTGGITDSFTNFTHGFSAAPTDFEAFLINVQTDLGFASGDIVPVDEFTDSAGLPAFTVSVNATNVKVERHPANIYFGDGTAGAITTSKWNLRVRASVKTATSTNIFPALTIAVKQPLGAFANGNDLFYAQYGSNNSGITYISRLALANNNVTLLQRDPDSTNPQNINAAQFKLVSGVKYFVFTSTTGVYQMPMTETVGSWFPTRRTTADANSAKPVHLVESGGSITEVYGVVCSYLYPLNWVSNVICVKVTVSGSTVSNYGTALDLTSATIKSADGTAGNIQFRRWHQAASLASILLFQYNPVLKRIYVITTEDFQLHIFKILTSADFKTWWDLAAATRAADLQYVKTIGIAGDGAAWADLAKERIVVDFDLDTGAERAIILSRYGNAALSGSVTRIPWKE